MTISNMTLTEETKDYIRNKYGGGRISWEACDNLAIACLTNQELKPGICCAEVLDWCYTNIEVALPKKVVMFESVPSGASVEVMKR